MNRKERRALKSAARKAGTTTGDLEKSLGMFDMLPDACTSCSTEFDKRSKEMAFTWRVVVRKDPDSVRLFCPACVDKVREFVDNNAENMGGKDGS